MEKEELLMSEKTILDQWRDIAYNENADKGTLQRFWANYFNIEKNIYEQLLTNPDEAVKGTVKELATGSADYGWFPGWNQRQSERAKPN